MNTEKDVLCVGGPYAGMRKDSAPSEEYDRRVFYGVPVYYFEPEFGDFGDIAERLMYGYEQHCKHVAERNEPLDKNEQEADELLSRLRRYQDLIQGKLKLAEDTVRAIKDHYTASFLKSCRTVIIPNPLGESTPLTLSYGKHHLGYLNDQMEFVLTVVTEGEKGEMNKGRIGVPIAIIP